MLKIIAISNQKGGVGKTTSTINIGAYLSKKGYKVLLIDMDPQCNLSSAWECFLRDKNVFTVLLNEIRIQEAIIDITDKMTFSPSGSLHLIPCSKNLARFEKLRAGELNAQFDLKKALTPVMKKFDLILIDCPPSLGFITINAFSCAQFVLTPIEAQLFAMDGLQNLERTIKEVKNFSNPLLQLSGIFFIRYNKRKLLDKEVFSIIKEKHLDKVLSTTIRENISLREAPHAGKDIFSYDGKSNGAKDYQKLTEEILQKL